jgi:hypothetical protein
MTFENAVHLCIAVFFGTFFLLTYISDQKQTHYWRGRKDGWDMHRRMIQNKTEQVFNYDDYK